MTTPAVTFVRASTLVFAYVFTAAAVAALALFPFEAVAVPLLPGILLALAMRASAARATSSARKTRDELKELVHANVGVFSISLPLAGGEVWLDGSHSSLALATCVLSALAILHGVMTFVAFHLPAARAPLSAHSPCNEC